MVDGAKVNLPHLGVLWSQAQGTRLDRPERGSIQIIGNMAFRQKGLPEDKGEMKICKNIRSPSVLVVVFRPRYLFMAHV